MIYKSPFATNKINEEIINSLKTKGVIVFGTGNFGSLVNAALMSYGIKINHFIDNNLNHWGKDFEGIKILSAKEVADKYAQGHILIASLNFKYIRRQLKDLNIKNVFDVDFLFENFDLSKSKTKWSIERCKVQLDLYNYSISSFRDKDFLQVNSIDLVLTEKCSLKCKDTPARHCPPAAAAAAARRTRQTAARRTAPCPAASWQTPPAPRRPSRDR